MLSITKLFTNYYTNAEFSYHTEKKQKYTQFHYKSNGGNKHTSELNLVVSQRNCSSVHEFNCDITADNHFECAVFISIQLIRAIDFNSNNIDREFVANRKCVQFFVEQIPK